MNSGYFKSVLILFAMVSASALAVLLTPNRLVQAGGPGPDLERVVPAQFGVWRLDDSVPTTLISPDVQDELDRIYANLLMRVYKSASGERIMLSIAYGSDQSDNLQVHKPEVCYTSQGFAVRKAGDRVIAFGDHRIEARSIVASRNDRTEPVTYWVKVGDEVINSSFRKKLHKIGYGLKGYIPDGLLFRVSNLGAGNEQSFELHDRFIEDLLDSLAPQQLYFLSGIQ